MSHPGSPRHSYRIRIGTLLSGCLIAVLGACGSSSSTAGNTLPPIATTTTTTTMPPTTTTIPSKYVIKKGDSLSGIAKMFGLSTAALAAYNNITNPDAIQAGQTLKIPQPGETTTTTSTATTVAPTGTT